MKNKHIVPGQVVPVDIRLEVYKDSLTMIREGIRCSKLDARDGLCLLLPCVLWNLKDFIDDAPSGQNWCWTITHIMFPELTNELISTIKGEDSRRIELLKQFIKQLTPSDVQES